MATIDSNIALGVKPLQVENPMNQYAALSQIQNAQNQNIAAQNQNALAQYQLSSAKRGDEGQNALAAAYQKAYDPEKGTIDNSVLTKEIASSGHGYLLPKVQQDILAREEKAATLKKTNVETAGLEFKHKNEKANKAITDIAGLNTAQEALMGIDKHLAKGDLDQDKANMLKAQIAQMPFPKWKQSTIMGILSAQEKLKAEHDLTMADIAGSNLKVNQQQANTAAFNATKPVFSEAAGGFVTLPTAQNPTSAIIPLANPQDTTKGKVVTQGKGLVNDVATEMANAYGVLKDLKGIKSKDNTRGQNISAALGSSSVGQMVGSLTGSQEQDARDVIMSQRPILVQGIVKATGMSASQINSNQELKTLLDAATDPSKGYETNINTLNKINKRFGLGGDIVDLSTTPNKTKSGSTTSNW
jgi:hypothetical protein